MSHVRFYNGSSGYLYDYVFLQSCKMNVCWKRISDTRFGYIRQCGVYLFVVSHKTKDLRVHGADTEKLDWIFSGFIRAVRDLFLWLLNVLSVHHFKRDKPLV